MAMFGAAFGLAGLVTRIVYDMPAIPSVLWSALAGILVAGLAQALFIYVLLPTTTSHVKLTDDATGRTVDVIITIPSKGKGTVAYDGKAGRVTLAAISSNGRKINNGESVVVEKIVGRVAYVSPASKQDG